MTGFFLDYRDPLFGLIIFFTSVFFISVANYVWNEHKKGKEKSGINEFLKSFDIVNDTDEYSVFIEGNNISPKMMAILASGYAKNGEFEKAIGVYMLMLSKSDNKDDKIFIFNELASVYFKAGFLQKCINVCLEIAKMYPRDKEALWYLYLSYEKIKDYDKALEVLKVLEAQGQNAKLEIAYIRAGRIKQDINLSINEKIEKLKDLAKQARFLERDIFALQNLATKELSFDVLDGFDFSGLVDILWRLDENWLIELTNPVAKEITNAKKLTNHKLEKYRYFEFEILSALDKKTHDNIEVNFNYTCTNCTQSFPVFFHRCVACNTMGKVAIVPKLSKKESINL